ncbi:hypothetical protein [Clostridium saccharobutylicum]|uniref:Uncharacterized protein n=1 Tax=Clostridium saccharobutylicum DSM 13864 TaxID=1345695 RepID=U5MUC0_CLOSA|nr:hypothetical protein [Clostridium saccharobutylicum]AGX44195.1 hypothetical protein CLSA_c32290 [Clostridium saccharobutylicum DSM 13864]AQR91482.1 hypothetical protein CLOSC_32070 [Clostridium saccharobutylicum]AQS01387.1 hypothetical protein CSACC_32150 [Clostridium saccharobutylicum]AQS15370.1 hypothetical protein CLOSACC_32150 [Clostridium saccharobutylicum]MBA2906140.1 small acid-soluble spore protein (thioredoxin-like protein) [Clostridium saccharobutylicum]
MDYKSEDKSDSGDVLLSNLTSAIQNFHYRGEMLGKTDYEKVKREKR